MSKIQSSFTTNRAAKYLGISESTMRLWRSQRKGPKYFNAGEKLIRYRLADLDAWIEENIVEPKEENK